MKTITAKEWELLTFFEVEPNAIDDAPFPYTDLVYCLEQGRLALSFAIAPAYRDVRIVLSLADHRLFELNARGVNDVRYHKANGVETLQIIIDERDSLLLKVKPRIEIEQVVQRDD